MGGVSLIVLCLGLISHLGITNWQMAQQYSIPRYN